jgi:hypothetical protein
MPPFEQGSEAYRRGQAAKRRGAPIFSNPYDGGLPADDWRKGYDSVDVGSPGETKAPPLVTRRGAARRGCRGVIPVVNPDLVRDEQLNPRGPKGRRRNLTPEEVSEIRKLVGLGFTYSAVAVALQTTYSVVYYTANGRHFKTDGDHGKEITTLQVGAGRERTHDGPALCEPDRGTI